MDWRDAQFVMWVLTPLVPLVLLADNLASSNCKKALLSLLIRKAGLLTKAASAPFYWFVLVTSIWLSLLIVTVNGMLRVPSGIGGSWFDAARSLGPLLLAVLVKVLVLDYILALKSASLARMFDTGGSWRVRVVVPGVVVLLDLALSAVLVAAVINWTEVIQSTYVQPALENRASLGIFRRVVEFFHTIIFIMKDSMSYAFYVLNGSLIYYMTLGFRALAMGAWKHFDAEAAAASVFKIVGTIFTFVVFIILGSFCVAGR